MIVEQLQPYAAPPPPIPEGGMTLAERELGAFYTAIRRSRGPEAATRAARLWIDALEAADLPCPPHEAALRAVTISAASRLFVCDHGHQSPS